MTFKNAKLDDVAGILGVSLVTARQWVKDGMPYVVRGSHGKPYEFDVPEVVKWYADRQTEKKVANRPPDDMEKLELRAQTAKTEKLELELAKARDLVAPISETEQAWAAMMAAVRQNLSNVPVRCAALLLGEKNELRFKQVIAEEIRTALVSAASTNLTLDDDGGSIYDDEEQDDDDEEDDAE